MSQQFRQQSATENRSSNLKNNPTRSDQQSTHKIPNSILSDAYNNTSYSNVQNDVMSFAHSSSNIMYSSNNPSHSQMERNLATDNYTQASVNQKGGSIGNALGKMHHEQSSSATTNVMREMRNSGEGYNAVVAGLDKRTFNNPSEKQQIDIARRNLNK
ncbi:hypothetical protein NAEGRDRAFT_82098 [Naegleria gruberi]|uniref:Uncharacterized protein n=1 Tax=Naegleria gruberi TaxID=5762 RepID=D2W244_NAEGR|nr:uncharacterized protein NAEGRDRAFT_82098 [Naegleria gruberi]EFC36920.1 hypothetical protein NAEGRDRAFT_82098 [Naegleria gruberi]|eukprot:XP_002669664.1 hypothetical protein NAEGRDRAFT_82098 [Naegleria gruberi strain NEG-M]